MLLHLSFTARDPDRVGAVLAVLLGAEVVKPPSPPFPDGARSVCCFDDDGTMIELLPAGLVFQPGPDAAPRTVATSTPPDGRSGCHALFVTALSADRVTAIAARAGWPCGLVDTGLFAVLALWVEGTQLIELTTPELLPAYRRLYGAPGRGHIDRTFRDVEAMLRGAGH